MDKIIINIHSLVDVITNSSTELFVLDTEKSIETIKEILEKAIELHNIANNKNLQYSDIFEEPTQVHGKSNLCGWNDYFTTNIVDGIELVGVDDNSIPYWMFDFIENTFGYNTERHHLG